MATKPSSVIDRGRFRVVVVNDGAVQLADALQLLDDQGFNVLAVLNKQRRANVFVVGDKPAAYALQPDDDLTPGVSH